ncbi:hypothetical protein ACHQM5_002268 [Ranunculus cassubicifolius]
MATDSREARRKRILERGSDRMALITGRVESLSTPQPQSHHLHTVSLPASIYQSDSQSAASQDADGSNTELPTTKLEPQLRKCETHVDSTRTPQDFDMSRKAQPAQVPPSNSAPSREAKSHPTKLFTAKKISASISASENIRMITSFAIAILVILSQLRIPLLSTGIISAIVATKPVFLVLLTDLTILLALVLVEKQQLVPDKKDEESFRFSEGLDMLQNGFTVYKAFTAILMDCSIYFVVVVSGLSLVQMF